MTYEIIADGYFYRVHNMITGWVSFGMTSASQAGLLIERKAGKEAHLVAAQKFLQASA